MKWEYLCLWTAGGLWGAPGSRALYDQHGQFVADPCNSQTALDINEALNRKSEEGWELFSVSNAGDCTLFVFRKSKVGAGFEPATETRR